MLNEPHVLGVPVIPQPRIEVAGGVREERTIVTDFSPYTTKPEPEVGMSVTERIKVLWAVIEAAVEEAILAAETLYGPKTGEEKKSFVVYKVMALLKKLEGSRDFLPPVIERIVFKAAEWSLDLIIERVFTRLSAKGILNVAEAPSA